MTTSLYDVVLDSTAREIPGQEQWEGDALLGDSEESRALAIAGREHLMAYTRLTHRRYTPKEFHWEISDALQRVAWGETKRLMIFVPPRYGKSELLSVRFPAYYLSRNPHKNIIAISYNSEKAEEFGEASRDLFLLPQHQRIFPDVRLRRGSKSKSQWRVERPGEYGGVFGGYVGTGVGGSITGRGADVFLIDDPIKNRQEADSETYRKTVKDTYTSTVYTRLEGDAAIVLVLTRWHEDDLAGWLLSQSLEGGDPWEVIRMPVFTNPQETEVLWPEKYPLHVVKQIRNVVFPRDWDAMFMQEPSSGSGNIYKREWWQRYDRLPTGADAFYPELESGGSPLLRTGRYAPYRPEVPAIRDVAHYIDSSFKEGVANDYSVIATWGRDTIGRFYLIDLVREKLSLPRLMLMIHRQVAKWKQRFPYEQPVIIEDAASGQSAIQMLQIPYYTRNASYPALSVIPYPVTPKHGKIARAEGVSPIVEARRCYLPNRPIKDSLGVDLVEEFIKEHGSFPMGRFDDMVDTTAMALERMRMGGLPQEDAILRFVYRDSRRGSPLFGPASRLILPAGESQREDAPRTGNTLWGRS
jgi:predicted phage terminase large subunit-like protein